MSLHEFDALVERMQLAFDYAANLGQYIEAAKVLYQMNDQLPADLQLNLEELENENSVRPFISEYQPKIRSAIVQYRQRLMNF
jgi:FtsZ-binding cell division protein ZapB